VDATDTAPRHALQVAADVARGDAKAAGRTLGSLLHRAATSPAAMFAARLLVRAGV